MATLFHQRLTEAAKAGDIEELYVMLQEDSYILDVIDENPFINTPLHVAVASGQVHFVEEITNLKPSFARKLNTSGYSPLHLAAANGQVEIVNLLLKADSSLGQLQGREKKTSLHCAAIAGSIEALDEIIFKCGTSLRMKTVRKETALHLAVKHGQVETVKALLRWIEELNMEKLLRRMDQDGNTILHLATFSRQHEIVKMLCTDCKIRRAINANARNKSGQTALDLDESLRHPDEPAEVLNISNILHKAGSLQACNDVNINKLVPSLPTGQPRLALHRRQRIFSYFNFRVHEDTSLDVRDTMMVILTLIATITFDIGINPPGGNWQDNVEGRAGDPIWMSKDRAGYIIFAAANCAGFVLSSMMIFRLVEGYSYSGPVQLAQSLLVFTYVWSVPWIPYTNEGKYIILVVLVPLVVLALHWIKRKPRRFL